MRSKHRWSVVVLRVAAPNAWAMRSSTLAICAAIVLAIAAPCLGEDCPIVCQCAADPVYLQRDARSLERIVIMQQCPPEFREKGVRSIYYIPSSDASKPWSVLFVADDDSSKVVPIDDETRHRAQASYAEWLKDMATRVTRPPSGEAE